jgi:RNA polymerase sigma-70 factor (ECF subfamily)
MNRHGLGNLDDTVLVAQVQDVARGADERERAASALFERYWLRIYQFCRRYVRDHDLALDLAQDVLMQAYRNVGGFEGRAPFAGWLFIIARHRCLRAVKPAPLLRDEREDLDAHVDDAAGVDVQLGRRQELQHVLQLVHTELDETERQALMLRSFEQLPVEEITRMLGLDGAAGARAVLQRARRKLRAAVERASKDPP